MLNFLQRRGEGVIIIKRVSLFILLVFFMNIIMQGLNIKTVSAQENVNLEINLAKTTTGTAPFNTTGAGQGLHPGDDYSADDNIVRTLDIITYDLHYSVNPAGGVAANTTITSTIPLNAQGKTIAVWEDRLTTLYPGLTITDGGRTLTYNMGDKSSGNAYTFAPTAKVLTTAGNGEKFSVSATISADNATTQTTQPYEATVSALPKVDLIKQTDGTFNVAGPNGEKGRMYTFAIGLTVGDAKGGEAIPGTVTFTEDLSAFGLPNARLCTFDGKPAVGLNGDGRYVTNLPNGQTTGEPNEYSVAGTPTISATQNAPGENINISISKLDQEGRYFPTKNCNSTPIPADKKYIFAGYIALWVADSDIPLGNTNVTNKYTNLSLTGVSGTANYGGQSEPLDNNQVTFTIYKSNEGRLGGTYLSYTKAASDYDALPTQLELNSGDGVVYPGQTFGLMAQSGNAGDTPLNNYEMIIKIDPNKLQLTDLPGKSGVAYVLMGSSGIADIFDIQYGTGVYGSFDEQQSDTAQGAKWYNSTTEALASNTGTINKVRLIAKPGKSLPNNTNFQFGLNVTALNNPINTVIPSVMAVRADEVDGGKWRLSKYDPVNHNMDQGDRVFITEVLARVQKDTEPSGIKTTEVNKEVTFKLTPTLTTDSRYTKVSTVENVTITDTLPKGLTYVYGGSSLEPSSVVKNADGTTTITWNLGNININDTIAPITLKTHVDFDGINSTVLENKAVISTPLDTSSEAVRTSKYGINIVNLNAWGIGKSTPAPTVELGNDLTYTLKYAVFKEETFTNFKFIDILPYNGDTRTPGTSFKGTYTIKELSGTNGETFDFTTDPQSTINRDPLLNTNTWIPYTPEAAAGQNITAIKIHANTLNSANGSKEITVKLAPVNNKTGDIYVNNFSGRVSNVNAMVYSNDVPIRVVSSSKGDLVVKYLEQGTDKVLAPEFKDTQNVGTDYTTTDAKPEGYTLVATPTNATGKYIEGTTEVIYYYTKTAPKTGDLVVKYLEQGTDKVLAPEFKDTKNVGTDYTTIDAKPEGYTLVATPTNATGKYVDGTVEVIYYYVPKKPVSPGGDGGSSEIKEGVLVVKYLDRDTKKELVSNISDKKPVGTEYTTSAKDINGYQLMNIPNNGSGKYIDGTTEVIYYYAKKVVVPDEKVPGGNPEIKEGVLVVKYLDRDTKKELVSNITDKKPVGTEYTTSAKDINGYQLMNIPNNGSGKYIDGTTEVIYYYAKKVVIPDEKVPEGTPEIKEGVLVVKYLDRDTKKELVSNITNKKPVGTEYTATAKDIDGYELVAVPNNEKGKYIDGTTEVVYYYAPKKVIVPQEKIAGGAPLLPKTGEGSSIPYYALGILLLIAGLRINSRKSKKDIV